MNRKRNAADKREGQTREARHAGRNLHAPTGSGSASGLTQVGSYVSKYCEQRPGIYRLIGLDEANKPAVLNRLLGQDHTGTLYIGCEGKNFAIRSRLTKLVRSCGDPKSYRYNKEHEAGYRLRSHPILSQRFPESMLAITWCHTNECKVAEDRLLDAYFNWFGDLPPLNWRK